jgi:anti-sigma factor RsiW
MTNDIRHFDEELSALADNRLDAGVRASVEAHLAVCPVCRARVDALRRLKASLAASRSGDEAPADLGARIQRVLDAEDRPSAFALRAPADKRGGAFWTSRPFLLAASVALVVAVATAFYLSRRADVTVASAVAEDFRAFKIDRLTLDMQTANPQELEEFFARGGIRFQVRVFDFGMMNYSLSGGRVHVQAGRPAALYAYRAAAGSTGDVIVCQMFPGSLGELPEPSGVRHHKGMAFHVFRDRELTLVFWQEGEIVCVLAGAGDPETVIQFAFAKAVKV